MFSYRYPQFESKRLLRAEMLNELRDYPIRFMKAMWDGYAQGIAAGCAISWSKDVLTVSGGAIYRNKQFYFMEEPVSMECKSLDRLRYLKVRFKAEKKTPGEICSFGNIILEEDPADDASEIELCRFRLQEGARLRDRHENFEDFSTEYDTVDYTYSPWAGHKSSTLNPLLLMQFAREMIKKNAASAADMGFIMAVFANSGHVDQEAIREYIKIKTGIRPINGPRGLYEGLLNIIKEDIDNNEADTGKRSVLLI